MATGKLFSIIAASLVLLLASSLSPVLGFGPFIINSPSQQQKSQSRRCQIPTISTPTAASRSFTIRMANNDDEESSSSNGNKEAAEDHDNISKTSSSSISEATAGGGTIAISSAKAAADAAEQSTSTTTATSNNSKSPSKTGFSLILLPTLLLKFTIVLIVKFATDVVVYPLLYLWRWGRMGKKKVVKGIKRLFGKEDVINGGEKVNGDSA